MEQMVMGKVVLTWQPDNFSNLARRAGQKSRKRICPFSDVGVTEQLYAYSPFIPTQQDESCT